MLWKIVNYKAIHVFMSMSGEIDEDSLKTLFDSYEDH